MHIQDISFTWRRGDMRINEEVVLSKMNDTDGGMLFDLKSGSYYRVNDVACFIIECIKSGKENSIEGIADCLCEEYEVDQTEALGDVKSTIDGLIAEGIVIRE